MWMSVTMETVALIWLNTNHMHTSLYTSLHSALVSNTGTGNGTVDTPINLVIHIYSATHSCLFPYRKEISA